MTGPPSDHDITGAIPEPIRLEVAAHGEGGIRAASIVAEVPFGLLVSGLAHLPDGAILGVDDDSGVCEIRPGGKPRLLFPLEDGEGITADDEGRYVYVVEERERRVRRLEVTRDRKGGLALRDTKEWRRLPTLKGEKNSGWEGVSFLSKRLAGGDHDYLVCVHEGSPRRIGIYALPDLDEGHTLRLPKTAKALLPDLADVAVDPRTGHLFVVSDRSRTLVEFEITRAEAATARGLLDEIELVALAGIELPLSSKRKPEALDFDGEGRLWVGLDHEKEDVRRGVALVIEITRGAVSGA